MPIAAAVEPSPRMAVKRIYQVIYRRPTGDLRKPAPSPLRTGLR